ncbi:MAG TPA: FtsK/SpoIIIE domain-containing protein [Roseiflexaceae bacterium]|nr:FtsK/SpoIIIE domain-containing protein [Roseiflexaceae bacterium]
MREWFSEPSNMVYALLTAVALMALVRAPRALGWLARTFLPVGPEGVSIRQWFGAPSPVNKMPTALATGEPAGSVRMHPQNAPAAPVEETGVMVVVPVSQALPQPTVTCVRGTNALLQPPGLAESLRYMREASPGTRYLVPLGWHRDASGGRDLVHTTLVGETNNMLITAQADGGKDSLAWWMFLSLAQQHDPREIQFCLFDGKGLDFDAWDGKAHTWGIATRTKDIPELMRCLTAERERRREVMRGKASKWENYRGGDLPLLVVYISELALLEVALKEETVRIRALPQKERPAGWMPLDLETWLSAETTSGRAFGLRYVIGTQSVSGMRTLWRSQTSLYVAGSNPDPDVTEPNTNWTPKRIEGVGAVPPFKIPVGPDGAGVFTIISGDQAVTVRSTYLDEEQRLKVLADLPDVRPSVQLSGQDTLSNLLSLDTPQTEVAQAVSASPAPTPAVTEPAKSDEKPVQNFAPSEEGFAASESDFVIFNLRYSPAEIAVIAARIARGEMKSKIVPKMPQYDTRKHRMFAAYYDMLYKAITEQGVEISRATRDTQASAGVKE